MQATDFADADRYRAVTHNKGVMNGIDAVAIATGNDWRAIEAAAHAWAARDGAYRSLTQWSIDGEGRLAGTLSLPLKVGTVGGSLRANPAVETAFALLGVESAPELAGVMGAVGLAQNLAALRALVTHGIQKGHMALHARNIAIGAGAVGPEIEYVTVVPDTGALAGEKVVLAASRLTSYARERRSMASASAVISALALARSRAVPWAASSARSTSSSGSTVIPSLTCPSSPRTHSCSSLARQCAGYRRPSWPITARKPSTG